MPANALRMKIQQIKSNILAFWDRDVGMHTTLTENTVSVVLNKKNLNKILMSYPSFSVKLFSNSLHVNVFIPMFDSYQYFPLHVKPFTSSTKQLGKANKQATKNKQTNKQKKKRKRRKAKQMEKKKRKKKITSRPRLKS